MIDNFCVRKQFSYNLIYKFFYEWLQVNMIKKNYKSSVILIFFFIVSIIIVNVQYEKKIYSVNLILEKNMTPILIEIGKNNSLDANNYTFYKREMKNLFDSTMINTKNSNKNLAEIYEICEIFKITNDEDEYYQRVNCLTTKPEFAPKLIEKNLNNIWAELHKKYSYNHIDRINLNINNYMFIKLIENKITYTNNRIKNIAKYTVAIIFLFVLFHLRKDFLLRKIKKYFI